MNSSGGRKHSESRSETRQPKTREKTSVQTTNAAVMNGPGNRKRKIESAESVTTVDLDTDSSGGDGSSSTSLQSTQPKVSRPDAVTTSSGSEVINPPTETRSPTMTDDKTIPHDGLGDQQLQPTVHRYMVHISDTSLLHRTRSVTDLVGTDPSRNANSLCGGLDSTLCTATATTSTGGVRSKKTQRFRFECELGDMWMDNIYDRSRRTHRKVTTGSPPIDKAVESMELQGYSMLGLLAKGKFGFVLAAHSAVQRKNVAIKILTKEVKSTHTNAASSSATLPNSWSLDIIPTEMQFHRQLKHANIVELMDYHIINGRIAQVLELCVYGNLRHLLTATPGRILTEPICRRYFRDMLEAVAYLHSQCIVHRDIKCENFILDRHDRIKLCDLGSASRFASGDELYTVRHGSAGYWSPEVLEHRPYNPRTADVWALGVTLHILLTSRVPFVGDDLHSLMAMQKGLDLNLTASIRLSREVSELLRGLLHYVLKVRYTINRVRCSDWLKRTDTLKPYIGNLFLVSVPNKFCESPQEKLLKQSFGI